MPLASKTTTGSPFGTLLGPGLHKTTSGALQQAAHTKSCPTPWSMTRQAAAQPSENHVIRRDHLLTKSRGRTSGAHIARQIPGLIIKGHVKGDDGIIKKTLAGIGYRSRHFCLRSFGGKVPNAMLLETTHDGLHGLNLLSGHSVLRHGGTRLWWRSPFGKVALAWQNAQPKDCFWHCCNSIRLTSTEERRRIHYCTTGRTLLIKWFIIRLRNFVHNQNWKRRSYATATKFFHHPFSGLTSAECWFPTPLFFLLFRSRTTWSSASW